MNFPLAMFSCFSVLVFFIFAFLLIVYTKELNREEKTVKEMIKAQKQQFKVDHEQLLYLLTPPPQQKKKVMSTDLSALPNVNKKKDIN